MFKIVFDMFSSMKIQFESVQVLPELVDESDSADKDEISIEIQ